MRIAVTGASGFVGGCIARFLVRRGHDIVALGRRPDSELRHPFAAYVQWDLRSGPIALRNIDGVVHCAAHVGQWGPERLYRAVNVDGTRSVLETFRRVARFVHISTASVYATDQPRVKVREEARIGEPLLTAYARTKAEAERILNDSGRAVVILRPHAVYGPGDATLLPRVLAARCFGVFPLPGDGRNRISVTSVFNLALAVQLALESDLPSGVFNIADEEEPTIDDMLRTMLRRHGVADRLLHVPHWAARSLAAVNESVRRVAHISSEPTLTRYAVAHLSDSFTLDLTRARTQLGYAPQWTFRDAPLSSAAADLATSPS
jgi:nucleoside-diphosphate-sugar epimerase